ncbi:MAG: NAD(P)/FAD-dependent oxidoreductase [Polyangiaceae bacterium]|nr:NAD(P)/FAD-dependent oxidoreductase [Polyangiaceae bacterium]
MAPLEIVIVGGGPAGISTALSIARRRPDLTDRLAVLEKERYPRDKYCAGAIGARADRVLLALGARVDVPAVPIHGLSAALSITRRRVLVREEAAGRVVRRIELDHALALAARRRGVRVIEGARAARVAWAEGGVTVETSAGPFRARAVVGADGVGSVIRRAMGLPFGRVRAQVVEVDTEPTPADGPRDILHFDMRDRSSAGYAWDFPTLVDGRELVCRGAYVLHPDALGGAGAPVDPETLLRTRMAEMGLDLGRYRIKRFAERGLEPGLPISRPRALLAGEAAGIDPMLGEGIAQAIAYGELAGGYLAERLAEGDLRFHDWGERVRRARLGRDLRIRDHVMRRFYGPGRAAIERFLEDEPAFLRAGLRYFGGLPTRAPEVARAVASAALLAARIEARALLE